MNKGWTNKKTRSPNPLKCSKSKTIRHRKLKNSRSTWCEFFIFLGLIVFDLEDFQVLGGLVFLFTIYISIMHLWRKNMFTHYFCRKIWIYVLFCRPESFARKSILSVKFSIFLPLVLPVTCPASEMSCWPQIHNSYQFVIKPKEIFETYHCSEKYV